ncbi:MAG: enoyl-CoA hydratase/isomerase family protein [Gemmatimonadetes bacterium]|nr:enoyl-CoA hydratase/isomerase family protein [Gemmatimonadota bacterium]
MTTGVETWVEGRVARVRLNQPPLNILTAGVLDHLALSFQRIAADPHVRVVLLDAAGNDFSAGADVAEHLPPAHRDLIVAFRDLLLQLEEFPLPLLAAVRGRCLGGGFELVQLCDLVVAGESARFGQPEIALGVIAPFASASLPRLAGRARAAALLFAGDTVTASEAQNLGLVSSVVPDDDLEPRSVALAQRIAEHSAAALRIAKRALRIGAETCTRRAGLEVCADLYLGPLMETRDAVEGLRAFLEKRRPTWVDG